MTGIKKLLFAGVWVICAAALTGCYGDIKDLCEKEASCEGGNDADEKACVEEWKGDREVAKEYDCKDQFDEAMECAVDNAYCESDADYNYLSVGDQCENLFEAYYDCEDAASAW